LLRKLLDKQIVQAFLNTRKQVCGRDARADIALGLRLVDDELVARQDLWTTQV
jgi:hypothetical protein